jgi:hypothetical protein
MATAQLSNDEIAAKRYGAIAEKFIADSQSAVWIISTENLKRITDTLKELGLEFDDQGLRIAALDCLSRNQLKLKPVAAPPAPAPVVVAAPPPPPPAPKPYAGNDREKLTNVGHRAEVRMSATEREQANREDNKAKFDAVRGIIDNAERRKAAQQRFEEENETVYRGDGRVDHAKTDSVRKAARARWAAKS